MSALRSRVAALTLAIIIAGGGVAVASPNAGAVGLPATTASASAPSEDAATTTVPPAEDEGSTAPTPPSIEAPDPIAEPTDPSTTPTVPTDPPTPPTVPTDPPTPPTGPTPTSPPTTTPSVPAAPPEQPTTTTPAPSDSSIPGPEQTPPTVPSEATPPSLPPREDSDLSRPDPAGAPRPDGDGGVVLGSSPSSMRASVADAGYIVELEDTEVLDDVVSELEDDGVQVTNTFDGGIVGLSAPLDAAAAEEMRTRPVCVRLNGISSSSSPIPSAGRRGTWTGSTSARGRSTPGTRIAQPGQESPPT